MKQLGIEPSLLLAQIINFSIIAFVLAKLLYKPILDMLAKRKKEIEEGLAITERMRSEEEKLKVREMKLIDQAKKDAKEIIEKARKDALDTEKQIMVQAHEESNATVAKTKAEIERLHQEMLNNVKKEVVDLAAEMTKKLTSGVLSGSDQHRLITKQLKELKSMQA
jgi:F-type H+-transporting ATPase subunit b